MNSKVKRQVISLAMAVLILAASAAPALAWFDEGAQNYQSSTTMTTSTLYRGSAGSAGDSVTSEYPLGLLHAESW
jgi:hypothetical protein